MSQNCTIKIMDPVQKHSAFCGEKIRIHEMNPLAFSQTVQNHRKLTAYTPVHWMHCKISEPTLCGTIVVQKHGCVAWMLMFFSPQIPFKPSRKWKFTSLSRDCTITTPDVLLSGPGTAVVQNHRSVAEICMDPLDLFTNHNSDHLQNYSFHPCL